MAPCGLRERPGDAAVAEELRLEVDQSARVLDHPQMRLQKLFDDRAGAEKRKLDAPAAGQRAQEPAGGRRVDPTVADLQEGFEVALPLFGDGAPAHHLHIVPGFLP